jgi:hypothetical protein
MNEKKRRGPGKPPLLEGTESERISARVTPEEKEKFKELGGAAWLRQQIRRAKIPTPKSGA